MATNMSALSGGDAVARFKSKNMRANFFDNARNFMAWYHGHFDTTPQNTVACDNIMKTNAARFHANQYISWAHFGDRYIA
jgi:hypothetical protein